MKTNISFVSSEIHGIIHYTPVAKTTIRIGERSLGFQCIKISNCIKVYIDIDNEPQGYVYFDTKKGLLDFIKSIKCLSNSPYYPIRGNTDIKVWKGQFKFMEELLWKNIEETITFFTLVPLIELAIPTNWLLLLPLE